MNKLAAVLGVAAVATITGCKDPDYNRSVPYNTAKNAAPVEVEPTAKPEQEAPAPEQVQVKKCTCAPGTKHYEPCECGAEDCACVVTAKPLPPPAEPETTEYVVQRGDYLAKISKKYNVTINSIKRVNGLKSDTVRVGQKLKLPGKHEVVYDAPAPEAKPTVAKNGAVAEYTGATKEYIVKNGDTLGAIAYSNGINIRQLKKLNALTSDNLRIGQKLKVPAEKVAKSAAKKPAAVQDPKKTEPAKTAAVPKAEPVKKVEKPVETTPAPVVVEEPKVEESAPVPVEEPKAETQNYIVKDGEDLLGISIQFGVPATTIRELNNLPEDAQVKAGDVLKIPAEVQ